MDALHSESHRPDDVFRAVGSIARRRDEDWTVNVGADAFSARLAVGCLVKPEAGDLVVVEGPMNGPLYITTVLERTSDAPIELTPAGDVAIRCEGKLTLEADGGVELRSREQVAVGAKRFSLHALESDVFSGRFKFVSQAFRGEVERAKLYATTFDSVVERFSQTLQRSYRNIAESEVIRAEEWDVRAKKTLGLHARNAFVTAKKLVKMNGAQVHIG